MFHITQELTYAIVGASRDKDKFGYKVLFDLLDAGYSAIPINPKGDYIEDVKVFKKLSDIPSTIDVAVFVVPPVVTESVLEEVHKLGITKVWMQPGSSSQDAIEFCEKNNIDCMHDVCVMLNKN